MGRGVDKGSRGREREKTVKNGGGQEHLERRKRGEREKGVRVRKESESERREANQFPVQQARRPWLLLGNCRVELPGRA